MEPKTFRPTWKTLLAFAIIYFVWGSTFFAIRMGVREVPPMLIVNPATYPPVRAKRTTAPDRNHLIGFTNSSYHGGERSFRIKITSQPEKEMGDARALAAGRRRGE